MPAVGIWARIALSSTVTKALLSPRRRPGRTTPPRDRVDNQNSSTSARLVDRGP